MSAVSVNLHLEIDNYKENPMWELPDGSFMLCWMLPPQEEIRYYFSLSFKDEAKLWTLEEQFMKGLLTEKALPNDKRTQN